MIRVRDGDVRKLGLLFERHHRRLYGFLYRLTGDRAAAEDAVQEVFRRMLSYKHTFRGHGDVLHWMYHLARNVATDLYRRRRPTEPLEHEVEGDRPSPAEGLEDREETRLLRRALLAIGPAHREVLVLSRYEGLKYREIAELLDCPVGTIKARVHRAVDELRSTYLELAKGGATR